MSDSVRPHRRQPTRLPRPWDSLGTENTRVACHFVLQCMKMKSEREVTQSCPTLSDPTDCSPPGSSVHGTKLNKHKNPSFLWENGARKIRVYDPSPKSSFHSEYSSLYLYALHNWLAQEIQGRATHLFGCSPAESIYFA